ncbi:Na+/H+ antiporter subunit E [Nocardioides gilvus]|uniref:Na+/H+ antiporter subunit E n=1 Tax=Nocardioides gilvus TaxID=1735589 RepID=UPI00194E470D|nr:Na+/H+ antiporter subunit E [Nocardioides gilvus]
MTLLRLTFIYGPWLVWQLLLSTLRLAVDVCRPVSTQRPRIVKLSLGDLTDLEVSLLTSSITITPGTLVLGVSPQDGDEPRAAFVQALFGDDEAEVIGELEGMRDMLRSSTRGGRP